MTVEFSVSLSTYILLKMCFFSILWGVLFEIICLSLGTWTFGGFLTSILFFIGQDITMGQVLKREYHRLQQLLKELKEKTNEHE